MRLSNSTPHAKLRAVRQELHTFPELGYEEKRTSAFVAEFLSTLQLNTIRTGIAETGLTATLVGGRPGPTTLLRADMDGLPVTEQTGAPYASQTPGRMHACGHDAHMSILLNAAETLSARRDELHGTVVFCFQPAEEGGGGAKRMLEQGVLENPHIDRCFALHVYTGLQAGAVGIRDGAFFAAADRITITLRGLSGHGALPHEAVDSIVAGAHLVSALQSVVSREINPKDPVVITIGQFNGGTASNVIADHVTMTGTVRCFDEAIRATLPERLGRIVHGIAAAFRVTAEFNYTIGYPSTWNDPAMAKLVRKAGGAVVGPEQVVEHDVITWSEDMAFMLRERPGAYFLVGARGDTPETAHPHHSPHFQIDERCLDVGHDMLVSLCLDAGA